MHPQDAAPGRRRRGRPPKRRLMGRIPTYHASDTTDTAGDDSDEETRILRAKRTTRSRVADQDHRELEIDEAGEKKVDKNGQLLGDRDYKMITFKLPSRGDKLFMFAMDAARLLGYRDSYPFFAKNPELDRVRLDEDEKQWLVKQRLLVTWFRNRDVAIVTARSVFRCFGAKVIQRGRRCRDDYFEARAREEGYGDEPEDDDGDGALDGLHGEAGGRRSLLTATARSDGYVAASPVNSATWMHHAALAVRDFNARLFERRSKASFFDVHTNVKQVATATQPQECTVASNTSTSPVFHFVTGEPASGSIGQALLVDTDIQRLVECLPDDEASVVADALRQSLEGGPNMNDGEGEGGNEVERYPLALIKGQYQASFAIDQTRFNMPPLKIPSPSETSSSIAANYYLNQVYQCVNRATNGPAMSFNGPPMSLAPPMAHTGPMGMLQSPGIPIGMSQPGMMGSPMPPMISIVPPTPFGGFSPRPATPPPRVPQLMCGYPVQGTGCWRPVSTPGERCQIHANLQDRPRSSPLQQSNTAGLCAECHGVSVPEETMSSKDKPICDVFMMVKCSKCDRRYHPICVELTKPRSIATVESYPWSCPDCKQCCVCKSVGDESTLLICDGCDRGWHMECCKPEIDQDNVPEGDWLCALCANCHTCGEELVANEYEDAIAPPTQRLKYPAYLATYCHRCYVNFDEERFCPVCLKTYSETEDNDNGNEEDNDMVACDACDHWVHTRCDETLTPEAYQRLCEDEDAKYKCPVCSDQIKPLVNTGTALAALKGTSMPSGCCVGLLGGKVKTRGVVYYKNARIGVPEINGTGMADMPS